MYFFHSIHGRAANMENRKFSSHLFRNVGCGVIVHIVKQVLPNSFKNFFNHETHDKRFRVFRVFCGYDYN